MMLWVRVSEITSPSGASAAWSVSRCSPWRTRVMSSPRLCVLLGTSTTGSVGITRGLPRSEEHTSELQSLMRISYAVFCLKKKKIIVIYSSDFNNIHNTQQLSCCLLFFQYLYNLL